MKRFDVCECHNDIGTFLKTIFVLLCVDILDLSFNKIYGSLPEQISMMSNLSKLFSKMMLSYIIQKFDIMHRADLYNSLNLISKRIETFSLHRNRITGTLPEDLHLIESLGTYEPNTVVIILRV